MADHKHSLKSKIKDWFTKKPKQSVWYYAFWVMVFRSLLSRFAYVVILQLGLLQPDVDVATLQPTFANIASNTVSNLINPLARLFVVGQEVTRASPSIGYFMAHYISYVYITILLAIAIMTLNGVVRHAVVSILTYRRKER